ncbi:uncharacterized protein LOC126672580 [Mercurialis annua]|uniref:uncharacterized protein LOC126672580 n=1 Tax=Mercurialis annua TaxID=3986 RepID=UPI00215DF780|nr:uncharacterized protein LOC126672580 [Mercurialis annua]
MTSDRTNLKDKQPMDPKTHQHTPELVNITEEGIPSATGGSKPGGVSSTTSQCQTNPVRANLDRLANEAKRTNDNQDETLKILSENVNLGPQGPTRGMNEQRNEQRKERRNEGRNVHRNEQRNEKRNKVRNERRNDELQSPENQETQRDDSKEEGPRENTRGRDKDKEEAPQKAKDQKGMHEKHNRRETKRKKTNPLNHPKRAKPHT